jgi:hypothetical protein
MKRALFLNVPSLFPRRLPVAVAEPEPGAERQDVAASGSDGERQLLCLHEGLRLRGRRVRHSVHLGDRRYLPRGGHLSRRRLRGGQFLHRPDERGRLSGQRQLRLVGNRRDNGDASALSGRSDLWRRRLLLRARVVGHDLSLPAAAGLPGERRLPACPMRLPAASCHWRRRRWWRRHPVRVPAASDHWRRRRWWRRHLHL